MCSPAVAEVDVDNADVAWLASRRRGVVGRLKSRLCGGVMGWLSGLMPASRLCKVADGLPNSCLVTSLVGGLMSWGRLGVKSPGRLFEGVIGVTSCAGAEKILRRDLVRWKAAMEVVPV